MIDNTEKTEALMEKMRGILPMSASVNAELHRTLREKSPELVYSRQCQVNEITYFGDDGGIMCHLDFSIYGQEDVHIVSITHLSFDRWNSLTPEIQKYQKHRTKRLRKLNGRLF
jgi:hypothetical protein